MKELKDQINEIEELLQDAEDPARTWSLIRSSVKSKGRPN